MTLWFQWLSTISSFMEMFKNVVEKRTDKKNHKNKLLKMSQWYGWFGLLFSLESQWKMGKIQCNDYVKSAITTISRILSKLVHSKGQANKKNKNTHMNSPATSDLSFYRFNWIPKGIGEENTVEKYAKSNSRKFKNPKSNYCRCCFWHRKINFFNKKKHFLPPEDIKNRLDSHIIL